MFEHPTSQRASALVGNYICVHLLVAFFAITTDASSLRQTPMVRAVASARPSVVNIHGKKTVRAFQDQDPQSTYRQVNGMGTGIVIDERGYVVTNYHVIDGVRRIQVTLEDKRTVTADLVAHDPKTDLAIIKLSLEEPLPVIKIGTSSDLMPAEPVVAVGNAYGYRHTVTQGIISELGRTVQVSDDQVYKNLIQTDASINPGNSGGPLLNIDGEMIGINVAVRVGAQGIGFAIPVDEALEVAARLIGTLGKGRISHGVVGRTRISDSTSKYVVDSVRGTSPAAEIGLQSGDVITSVDEIPIQRALDFERALLGRSSGDPVVLTVSRGDDSLRLSMKVGGPSGSLVSASEDPFWDNLGLRLMSVPIQDFRRLNTKYRGGLKIVEVRTGGPAAQQGIQPGDILVGMHLWETISIDNVEYILDRPELKQPKPFRFYVLRGGETLFGELQLASSNGRSPKNQNVAARKP